MRRSSSERAFTGFRPRRQRAQIIEHEQRQGF